MVMEKTAEIQVAPRAGAWIETISVIAIVGRVSGRPGGFKILAKEIQEQNDEIRQIVHVNTASEGKQIGYKKDKKFERCEHQMTQLTVRFDGLLRITDPDAFRETLIRGIGPAKAFGCGLMLVKRV